MMICPGPAASSSRGFTLTEIAVVLVILALLIGGLLVPLSAQDDMQRTTETRRTLQDIREALLGFAAANGRLPCPAAPGSNGQESFAVGGSAVNGQCSNFYDGFVPAVTLGIMPTDASGYAVDGWGNRIRYAVARKAAGLADYTFTATDGMKSATMSSIAGKTLLSVCGCGAVVQIVNPDAATCAGSCSASPAATDKLADNAPAVVFSLGKNAGTGGTGAGEQHNPNANSAIVADTAFVSHEPTAKDSTDGEFDDIVIWISPNILFSKMIAAGRLP